MKTYITLATLALSLNAFATDLISTEKFSDGKGNITEHVSHGFPEDGFGGDFETCYRGNVKHVCGLIRNAAELSRGDYSHGGHGYFDVVTCEVEGSVVNLSYEQITDYGNSDVKKMIRACE